MRILQYKTSLFIYFFFVCISILSVLLKSYVLYLYLQVLYQCFFLSSLSLSPSLPQVIKQSLSVRFYLIDLKYVSFVLSDIKRIIDIILLR